MVVEFEFKEFSPKIYALKQRNKLKKQIDEFLTCFTWL